MEALNFNKAHKLTVMICFYVILFSPAGALFLAAGPVWPGGPSVATVKQR